MKTKSWSGRGKKFSVFLFFPFSFFCSLYHCCPFWMGKSWEGKQAAIKRKLWNGRCFWNGPDVGNDFFSWQFHNPLSLILFFCFISSTCASPPAPSRMRPSRSLRVPAQSTHSLFSSCGEGSAGIPATSRALQPLWRPRLWPAAKPPGVSPICRVSALSVDGVSGCVWGTAGRFTLAALITKTGPSGCWLSKEELFFCSKSSLCPANTVLTNALPLAVSLPSTLLDAPHQPAQQPDTSRKP